MSQSKGLGLHVLENPSGTFSFVGSVPYVLGYVNASGGPVTYDQLEGQLRLPAKYRTVKSRSWPTRQDAIDEAKKLGFEVAE